MLFQPAVIAMLLASGVTTVAVAGVAPFAWELVRRWDLRSGSERQLRLERRTYLVSTLLTLVFATQVAALLLFVFNADRMSVMFVGAMCAVGALNANALGFPALLAQVLVWFLAALWLVLNHADTRAPDYPLIRVKYGALLGMAPVVAAAGWLQLEYFRHLNPAVITSCCGRLFSADAAWVTGDVAALAAGPAMKGFHAALALALVAALAHVARGRGGYLVAASAAIAFVAVVAGIVSFVSVYVYENPHHHCPFCLLKPEYAHQGYLLYVPLFAATAAGLGVGVLQPFARVESLVTVVPRVTRRLAWIAVVGFGAVELVATFMVWRSRLTLFSG